MGERRFSQAVSNICILAVAAAMAGIWTGSLLLLIAGLAAAVCWRLRLRRDRKKLAEMGILSLICCECFDGGCGLEKNQEYTARVYSDRIELLTGKKERILELDRSRIVFCGILSLDEMRNPPRQAETGRLGKEIQRTDQCRKKVMKNGEAKYLVINTEDGRVFTFFITAENQRYNRMYCEGWEKMAVIC